MSDYIVMQKQSAKVFLAGPPLVKMAINEDAVEEDLGGAEMHARVSGLSDYLAEDELDALRIGRAHRRAPQLAQARPRARGRGPGRARCSTPRSCSAIASADVRVPFDTREIIARIVDGSRFEEFKALYGSQLVTGWAELAGYPVGIIAQQRHPVQRGVAEVRAVHPAVQPPRHPDHLPAEHHRLHGRHPLRAARASSRTAPS